MASTAASVARRAASILVIDDEEIMREILEALLTREGHTVRLAADAAEGLELARTVSFDAAIVDIMMPGMDGYETIRRIRQNPRRRLMPILALTAKAMKGDREKCLEAGASDYIAKPVNTEELLALLRIWLFGKQRSGRKYS